MMHFIYSLMLTCVPTKQLWQTLLQREGFKPTDTIQATAIWQEAFHRVPMLKPWLRFREMNLLKSVTLNEEHKEYVLGQISENRLYMHFDVPMDATPKVDTESEVTIPDIESKLRQWDDKHADKK